jgi:hypothetical protein
MPCLNTFDAADFAPRAWAAICELCGGEDRVRPDSKIWRDSLIVNLGDAKHGGKPVPPQDLPEWHCDGDEVLPLSPKPSPKSNPKVQKSAKLGKC